MLPVLSLLVVLAISLLVTRIATVALTHTGLARESITRTLSTDSTTFVDRQEQHNGE